MHPVEAYLRQVRDIHASGGGVAETSYYAPLAELLNAVGTTVRPRVTCVVNVRNQGAGLPDGGFFTRDQLRSEPAEGLLRGQVPARGVMEVKGPSESLDDIAQSSQVRDRYCPRYGQVLICNLREFLVMATDAQGVARPLDRFSVAASEKEFWAASARARHVANELGDELVEFLRRAILRPAPLRDPADVAWLLASYAKDANARIAKSDPQLLAGLRDALEDALGLEFVGDEGDHFFRSSLVQTLFYGVFSAWVLWCRSTPRAKTDAFDWRLAGWSLHVPMVAALYAELNTPQRLGALDVVDLLTLTGEALNRVERDEFFRRFDQGQAVQYFYEPFLKAFDPELRKQLGVWYTPPEVVHYMVERVDSVLRSELGISDGLADSRVVVLDPCTGTGSFLLAVLQKIAQTLESKSSDALVPAEVRKAALERVYGFELLPAPFVIAHLQLGLYLQTLGAPLPDSQRASVYLTNSLTGWLPTAEKKHPILFPELEGERDFAEGVKQHAPVLVVIGNPPYNAFAGTSPRDEGELLEPYKQGLRSEWGLKKYNLDDLYVRFFRVAERRIAEGTGHGIVCLITNFSYLDEESYVVMRERLFREFDHMWFDSLNGDSRHTNKRTPDGRPDPSVFSTPSNPVGIRVGTAIGLLARTQGPHDGANVRFRAFWGAHKRQDLVSSLSNADVSASYEIVNPRRATRYSFRPTDISDSFASWPLLDDLSSVAPYQGAGEDRRKALIDMDREALQARMKLYFDPRVSFAELKADHGPLTDDYVDFPAKKVRAELLKSQVYSDDYLRRYVFRPLDIQWCYFQPKGGLWRRPRPEFGRAASGGARFLVTRRNSSGDDEEHIAFMASSICDYHVLEKMAVAYPLTLADAGGEVGALFAAPELRRPNASPTAMKYLRSLGLDDSSPAKLWMHALAMAASPKYLSENIDGLRHSVPRIPLPSVLDVLEESAELGRRVADLLDGERTVEGVTTGDVVPLFRTIAVPATRSGRAIEPSSGLDLAGWGYRNERDAVMPGAGRVVERVYETAELAAIRESAAALGLSVDEAVTTLGRTTFDVFLNDDTYWRNVPAPVWRYRITGNQVLKKWLSYRDAGVIGRAMTTKEARDFADLSRRVAAAVLMEPRLDMAYAKATECVWPWSMNEVKRSVATAWTEP